MRGHAFEIKILQARHDDHVIKYLFWHSEESETQVVKIFRILHHKARFIPH